MEKIVILFISYALIISESESATSSCFNGNFTKDIPATHIYYRIKKPAIIGYKGSILKYQENTLEGMQDIVGKFEGVHMQVQLTNDEKLIVFGHANLKEMTGVDVSVTVVSYKHIKTLNLQTSVVYGNKTLTYSKTAKIPLLEDVLNKLKGKGLLIYIELLPSDAPPSAAGGRYRSLRTGFVIAGLIKKLHMEDDVFVISADPFKLLALNYHYSSLVTGWVFKSKFYESKIAESIRKEFVDLNGLRTCYRKTAPQGASFLPFLLENGMVTKSVNGSIFDADAAVINNPTYLSGRSDKTLSLLKHNYNPRMSIGAFLSFYGTGAASTPADQKKNVLSLVQSGVDRIITDDLAGIQNILSAAAKTTVNFYMLVLSSLLVCLYF